MVGAVMVAGGGTGFRELGVERGVAMTVDDVRRVREEAFTRRASRNR
jgi:hypothetical protein